MIHPTKTYLRECFDYDRSTGIFLWIDRPDYHFRSERTRKMFNCRFSGKEAGTTRPDGYVQIYVNKKPFFAHRLVWIYEHGDINDLQIDHINHIKNDNRICNLRTVTNQENHRNAGISKNNTSGVTGVHWSAACKKWVAQIKVSGECNYIGVFPNISKAIESRKHAEISYGFHENHGS